MRIRLGRITLGWERKRDAVRFAVIGAGLIAGLVLLRSRPLPAELKETVEGIEISSPAYRVRLPRGWTANVHESWYRRGRYSRRRRLDGFGAGVRREGRLVGAASLSFASGPLMGQSIEGHLRWRLARFAATPEQLVCAPAAHGATRCRSNPAVARAAIPAHVDALAGYIDGAYFELVADVVYDDAELRDQVNQIVDSFKVGS